MRIIHTSDWHLGQTFFGYDRAGEHRLFLNWLGDIIKEKEIDLLLVAGDVFDNSNPSAESQKIYYKFIKRVTSENPGLKIVITAGNHDSAARLEAPNPLLREMNVTVRGIVPRTPDGETDFRRLIIPIDKNTCCLAVPFLRPGDFATASSYSEGVKALYDALYKTASEEYGTIIAMGHLQATGAEISSDDRSERTTIGGLDVVSPDFSCNGIAYTALGHLHKAQRVSGRENMRYSGAPLPMSFAERGNKQSVTMVVIDGEGVSTEKIPFDTPVKLLTIPSRPMLLDEVIKELECIPFGERGDKSPFLEVQILVDGPDPTRRQRIEEILEGRDVRLARISAVSPQSEREETKLLSYDDFRKIEPVELAKIVYKQKFNDTEMPENLVQMLTNVIKEVEE